MEFRTDDTNGQGEIMVRGARKYDIINLNDALKRRVLTLEIPKGIKVYAFTFG